jgi:hypothetical protein
VDTDRIARGVGGDRLDRMAVHHMIRVVLILMAAVLLLERWLSQLEQGND